MKDINVVIAKLERCSGLDDMNNIISEIADYYEVDHLAYHVVTSEHVARHVALVTYPEEWVKHYVNQNLLRFDPVVENALTGVLPFSWDKMKVSKQESIKMLHDANDAGLGNCGLTVSVRDQHSKFAMMTFNARSKPEAFNQLISSYKSDFMMLSYLIHNKVQTLSKLNISKVHLSPSELEVIKWAAAGKTVEDTATILGKAARTVRGQIDSARHKLGGYNKAHAVSRALELGIIDQISFKR